MHLKALNSTWNLNSGWFSDDFRPGAAPSQSEPRFLGRKKTIAQMGWFQAWCHAKLWMKRASCDSCEEVAAAFLGPKMNPLNKAEIAWHSWNGWHQLRSHICSGMFRVEQFMLMFWEPGIVDHLMPLACQNEPRRSICYIHFFASKWIKMVHLWFFCCSEWFIYDFSVVQNGSFMTFLLLKMVHLWLFCCWTWFIYVFSVAVALQQNAYRMLLRCWFRIRQRENKNASAFPQRCRIWNQDDTWMMFSLEFPAFQLWKTTFGDCQKHAE